MFKNIHMKQFPVRDFAFQKSNILTSSVFNLIPLSSNGLGGGQEEVPSARGARERPLSLVYGRTYLSLRKSYASTLPIQHLMQSEPSRDLLSTWRESRAQPGAGSHGGEDFCRRREPSGAGRPSCGAAVWQGEGAMSPDGVACHRGRKMGRA